MVKKGRINHKSLYKWCYTGTEKKHYNFKLALSLSIGCMGATIMQNTAGFEDTNASFIIKLGAFAIIGTEIGKFWFQETKKIISRRYNWSCCTF